MPKNKNKKSGSGRSNAQGSVSKRKEQQSRKSDPIQPKTALATRTSSGSFRLRIIVTSTLVAILGIAVYVYPEYQQLSCDEAIQFKVIPREKTDKSDEIKEFNDKTIELPSADLQHEEHDVTDERNTLVDSLKPEASKSRFDEEQVSSAKAIAQSDEKAKSLFDAENQTKFSGEERVNLLKREKLDTLDLQDGVVDDDGHLHADGNFDENDKLKDSEFETSNSGKALQEKTDLEQKKQSNDHDDQADSHETDLQNDRSFSKANQNVAEINEQVKLDDVSGSHDVNTDSNDDSTIQKSPDEEKILKLVRDDVLRDTSEKDALDQNGKQEMESGSEKKRINNVGDVARIGDENKDPENSCEQPLSDAKVHTDASKLSDSQEEKRHNESPTASPEVTSETDDANREAVTRSDTEKQLTDTVDFNPEMEKEDYLEIETSISQKSADIKFASENETEFLAYNEERATSSDENEEKSTKDNFEVGGDTDLAETVSEVSDSGNDRNEIVENDSILSERLSKVEGNDSGNTASKNSDNEDSLKKGDPLRTAESANPKLTQEDMENLNVKDEDIISQEAVDSENVEALDGNRSSVDDAVIMQTTSDTKIEPDNDVVDKDTLSETDTLVDVPIQGDVVDMETSRNDPIEDTSSAHKETNEAVDDVEELSSSSVDTEEFEEQIIQKDEEDGNEEESIKEEEKQTKIKTVEKEEQNDKQNEEEATQQNAEEKVEADDKKERGKDEKEETEQNEEQTKEEEEAKEEEEENIKVEEKNDKKKTENEEKEEKEGENVKEEKDKKETAEETEDKEKEETKQQEENENEEKKKEELALAETKPGDDRRAPSSSETESRNDFDETKAEEASLTPRNISMSDDQKLLSELDEDLYAPKDTGSDEDNDEEDETDDDDVDDDEPQVYHVQETRVKVNVQEDALYETVTDGVRKLIVREGMGHLPQPGDVVSMHCEGYLDAFPLKKFWSTKALGQRPFHFAVGKKQVIRGWDEGVASMKLLEKSKLKIKANKAYGRCGFEAWGIPPNTNLLLEVEVISIRRSQKV